MSDEFGGYGGDLHGCDPYLHTKKQAVNEAARLLAEMDAERGHDRQTPLAPNQCPMVLNHLHRWGEYQYLATMDRLMFFGPNGDRVAEWYTVVSEDKFGWWQVEFACLVNTLHADGSHIVKVWEDYVTEKYNDRTG